MDTPKPKPLEKVRRVEPKPLELVEVQSVKPKPLVFFGEK